MGELAAFLTAVCWAFTGIFFTIGGKEVGSVIVNRVRLFFAVVLLAIAHLISQGQIFPTQVSTERWFWLGLSGIVGLVIGDSLLLQSYVLIGTRLGALMMATVPIISTLLAWVFLGESLGMAAKIGIFITMLGIGFVILERGNGNSHHTTRRNYVVGLLLAFGGAVGDALGLILAKRGLEGGFPAISGVIVRMLTAMLVLWAIALFQGQVKQTIHAMKNRRALKAIAAGAFVGPFIGVWLSLVSIQLAYVGIASTLMALTPILLLPISYWFFKERITPRAIAGTVVSMIGIIVIFMVP